MANLMDTTDEVNKLVAYSGDAISMYTHTGTHIDTLNHCGYRNEIFNGFTTKDHLGSRTWDVCGAESIPPILARGVLIDVAAFHGVDTLAASHPIGKDDIEGALKMQGTKILPGDVVLVRTGQMRLFPDMAYYDNSPGLNLEGAEYIAKHGAIMIGTDTLSFEQVPAADATNYLPVHCYLLAEAGVPILELAYLEDLSNDKLYEFAFFGASIKLRGATGSPMRPVVMPLR